jgi:hypothetical protein
MILNFVATMLGLLILGLLTWGAWRLYGLVLLRWVALDEYEFWNRGEGGVVGFASYDALVWHAARKLFYSVLAIVLLPVPLGVTAGLGIALVSWVWPGAFK